MGDESNLPPGASLRMLEDDLAFDDLAFQCNECGVNVATDECLECACDLCIDCAQSVQGGYVCPECYDEHYADEEDETPDERKKRLLCTHSYALLPHGERAAWVSWGADGRYQRCQKCGEVRKTPEPQEMKA